MSSQASILLKAINPEEGRIPGISAAVRVEGGRLLLVSGHVPLDTDGNVVSKNLEDQLALVFRNLAATLTAAETSFEHVCRITIYVRDYEPTQLEMIRRVRDQFVFVNRPPASALIGVATLFHPDVRVEVDAVAVVPYGL